MCQTRSLKIFPVFLSHDGCPGGCIYCNQRAITGTDCQSPDEVRAALRAFCENTTSLPRQIAFFGGSFTLLPKSRREEWYQLAGELRENSGQSIPLRISTRPDAVDSGILQELEEHGVQVVELGVQSFDDEVLKRSGRGYSSQTAIEACRRVAAAGFDLVIQLMPGLPTDSRKRFMRSIGIARWLRPVAVRIYPAVVLKDTVMEGLWRRGEYRPLLLEDAVVWTADAIGVLEPVPVIKSGLHGGTLDVIAGPYHPAFGELVRGEVLFRRISGLLPSDCSFRGTLLLDERDISIVKGHGGWLSSRIERKFGLDRKRFRFDKNVGRGTCRMRIPGENGL